jgi:hypothetical protein
LQAGVSSKSVNVVLLDDNLPEPFETVFVYLTKPTGGARVAAGTPDAGLKVCISDGGGRETLATSVSLGIKIREDKKGEKVICVY